MGRSGSLFRGIGYEPLPSQLRFHKSCARFKGFSGPIGSGKSQALCHEAIKLTYTNAGRVGLVGAPTYPMLRDATLTSFTSVLEDNHIPYDYNKSEGLMVMKDTGSKVLFRAVDEFERLRGTNLAWFGVDELTYTQEEAWLRLEGRLRDPQAQSLHGFAVWTPKGFDWVYRRFISEPIPGYDAVLAKPFENRHVLDKIPDFYERLRGSYDSRFFEQEVMGAYLNVNSGAVYHAFDRKRNVAAREVDGNVPLLWALDFNVDPMCSVVVQKAGERVAVVDEIVLSRASTLEACEEFFTRYPYHAAGLVIYGDASGARRQTAGTSDYKIIREFMRRNGYPRLRLEVPSSNPPVRERVMLMNSKLSPPDGEPLLTVAPRCRELIKDFEEVVYKAESTVVDKDRDSKRTHLSDALGYLVWQECRPRTPCGEQNTRLL